MNDPVTFLSGVGEQRKKQFELIGIKTVGDLIHANPVSLLSIRGCQSLVDTAKIYIKAKESSQKSNSDISNNNNNNTIENNKKVTIGPKTIQNNSNTNNNINTNDKKILENSNNEELVDKKEKEFKYMISNHSWWGKKIELPRISKGRLIFQDAIIYELNINPKQNRISFLCSWIIQKEKQRQEKICNKTFSPHLIYHVNPNLPNLTIDMNEHDYENFPFKSLLTNILDEIELMKLTTEFDKLNKNE
jgi:hypothetical protein